MVDYEQLVEKVFGLLETKAHEHYRVCVLLVGPPGSGKSTVSERIRDRINTKYAEYLQATGIKPQIGSQGNSMDLTSDFLEISDELWHKLNANKDRILPGIVEDVSFTPTKYITTDKTIIIGRGGLPNAISIRTEEGNSGKNIDIAQIVPMDGFHLSRKCLDNFKNPIEAHNRRGSSMTFDSNNFLALVKVLARTIDMKPQLTDSKSILEYVTKTFDSTVPTISIPGFDHSVKDPTPNKYEIGPYTRILILEGLYLLHNKENWAKIAAILRKTTAVLIWNIDIEESVIEQRVAQRHLKSGLVSSLDEGVKKFQSNDLLNAHDIKENMINTEGILTLRND